MNPAPGRLLVVDDSPTNRDALARLLQREGYLVTVGSGGSQALDLLQQGGFDLIVLDIMMQDVNGLEVLQKVRATRSMTDLPVIMATARDQSEDIVRALQLGANDYVTKPLDFPVLLARIRTQLSLKHAVERILRLEQSLTERNTELEDANTHLSAANMRMEQDLAAAARVQEAFLPPPSPVFAGARFAWLFEPCALLAGDTLNVFPLDQRHVGLYVLDVTGHGVAASLLAVALGHVLSPRLDRASVLFQPGDSSADRALVSPAEVLETLNQRFSLDPDSEQYFTILYGILNLETGELRYVSAGHPGPLHLRAGYEPAFLDWPSLPIGVDGARYSEHSITLAPGDRVVFFSDGLLEAENGGHEQLGRDRVKGLLQGQAAVPLQASLEALWQEVECWSGGRPLQDDVSVLALEFTGADPAGR